MAYFRRLYFLALPIWSTVGVLWWWLFPIMEKSFLEFFVGYIAGCHIGFFLAMIGIAAVETARRHGEKK